MYFDTEMCKCSDDAVEKNQQLEFERNEERFRFLKWGAKAFSNMQIIPPGSGIVHQVQLYMYVVQLLLASEQSKRRHN